MQEFYEKILQDRFTATEAYTGNFLGIVSPTAKNRHSCSRQAFWDGSLFELAWFNRVVEIRLRQGEMPEVYFETEKSKRVLTYG